MPAMKAKSERKRTLRPRKQLTQRHPCPSCRDHALKALAWSCAMEKLELQLEQETARLLSVAVENERLSIEIARKDSVIKAYERAWTKGQEDPYTNGRCAK